MSDRAREFHRLFLRLRIADQLGYYSSRRTEYRRAHRQAVVVRNALLFAAAVAGGVGQFTVGTARAGWAVVGAVLASLAAAVTAFETLIGFPQLDKLFSDAARNLEEAAIDWEEADPHSDLTAEINRVEGVFRSENGQWGQLVVKSATPILPPPTEGDAAQR
ncbi:MAG: SLATT domain-containing protein [Pseudonocardia sp.]